MAPALRALLALSVTLGPLYNTNALSLYQKNSTLVTANLSGEESDFYLHEGLLCKMCPAGSYVFSPCKTTGTESSCKPCNNDTFTTHLNSLHACPPCKICRHLDQVTLKSCTRTSNAECACKSGTFCSPDQACETCQRCKPRCPDGEQMAQPCTPQSDIQCVPIPTSSPTPSPGKNNSETVTVVLVVAAIILVAIGFLTYKYRNKLRCCFRGNATRTRANSIHFKTKFTHGQPESEDNDRNTQVDLASQRHPGPSATRQPDETIPLQERECPVPIEEERRILVPTNEKDPEEALRLSFIHIVAMVPLTKWRPYMIALGLTENEIDIAKMNAKGDVSEQHFLMLRTWLEKNGKKASLDTLLTTLCDPAVNLKGVEQKIREVLISGKLYVYEE
ncbi:tumor necrosis factor receptor superfamily member 10B-like isoform X2 [Paroedura picta]|uniref:tumor necrosis factor receptor superfamily member 10B-like isoform X2 n=1 Tax=Paroedura picta TaxID=143630 RepID=UPI00405692D7